MIDEICNYIIDSDQKNRHILRLKALANAEFSALLRQLRSLSGLQLPECIFKYRISTLRNGNEASPRIQVQRQIVPKKNKTNPNQLYRQKQKELQRYQHSKRSEDVHQMTVTIQKYAMLCLQ